MSLFSFLTEDQMTNNKSKLDYARFKLKTAYNTKYFSRIIRELKVPIIKYNPCYKCQEKSSPYILFFSDIYFSSFHNRFSSFLFCDWGNHIR